MAEHGSTTPGREPAAAAGAVASAFAMLHPGVQRQLWRMGWTQLRQLQVDAIRLITTTTTPLVLAAATASGKTEAAFLPILSAIADEPWGSVRAVYVGPLKALINDQFSRVEELCEHLDVPVFRWHGDVAAAHKAKLVQRPGGVLLITPESLESLFVNRSQHLRPLLGGLRFVVIDELHSFLGTERGLHLRSLLSRVEEVSAEHGGATPRQIGLSATIGDFLVARGYLNPDAPQSVQLVEDRSGGRELKFRIHAYTEQASVRRDGSETDDKDPPDVMLRIAGDIIAHCAGAANLVFTNAKGDVEEYADLCGRLAAERGIRDAFLVHHGSLSADIREETESAMKGGAAATTFCSSTLEMGVDIGSVRTVGQVGPPWSVASLKQRLGRSGRRPGEPQVMRVYVRSRRPGADADLFDRLHLDVVQAIAITELLLEGWVEPPVPPHWDLSTLSQQIISVIAQTGGVPAQRLFERLCVRGPFREVEQSSFAQLLRQLAREDVLEQMDGEDLILGLKGEKIRRDRGFYAVFPTPEQYTVLHSGQALGSLECAHEKDDHLLFAGRRWRVTDADHERLELHVVPAHGWRRPTFMGGGGEVHSKVRQRMHEVLSTSGGYRYLDAVGHELLGAARRAAVDAEALSKTVIPLGPRRTALMTWTGHRVQETLRVVFQSIGFETHDEGVGLEFGTSEAAVRKAVAAALAQFESDEADLRLEGAFGPGRKYDHLLGDTLRLESYRLGWLQLDEARQTLQRLTRD